jgi:hypothetical protein
MLGRHNFKVITIAYSMGSEHSIVGTPTVKEYKQKKYQKYALKMKT